MNTKIIDKNDWKSYLEHFSKGLGACLTEVEIAGLDIGDQIEAEGVILAGISYDPKDDIIAVDLVSKDDENVEHIISHPAELAVQEEPDGVTALIFVDEEGHRQIIHLKKALALPAAT